MLPRLRGDRQQRSHIGIAVIHVGRQLRLDARTRASNSCGAISLASPAATRRAFWRPLPVLRRRLVVQERD
jgi:hypothetical protein